MSRYNKLLFRLVPMIVVLCICLCVIIAQPINWYSIAAMFVGAVVMILALITMNYASKRAIIEREEAFNQEIRPLVDEWLKENFIANEDRNTTDNGGASAPD